MGERLLKTSVLDPLDALFLIVNHPSAVSLSCFELFDRFGAANFYPTLGAAVDAYLHEHPVDWKP